MPLRNTVLFPQQVIPIYIGRDKSLKLINELSSKTKHVVVVAQEDGSIKTVLDGNQIIFNSGRVTLNSKENDIIVSSQRDIVTTANRDTIIDSGENIYIRTREEESPTIFLGTISNFNSVVKFNELRDILEDIKICLDLLANNPMAPTPAVPSLTATMNFGSIKSEQVKIGN